MLNKVLKIILIVVLTWLIFYLKWFLNPPNYEQGFERKTLTIADALNIVEVVVADLPKKGKIQLKPVKGYVLLVLGGFPSSDFIDRFRKYSIPIIRRGYIKFWAEQKELAQIEITKISEKNDQRVVVSGIIRYPIKFIVEFEYEITQDIGNWIITNRKILNS
jgi:hypothetical protein